MHPPFFQGKMLTTLSSLLKERNYIRIAETIKEEQTIDYGAHVALIELFIHNPSLVIPLLPLFSLTSLYQVEKNLFTLLDSLLTPEIVDELTLYKDSSALHCSLLASHLYNGHTFLHRDYKKSLYSFEKAAELGSSFACWRLGYFYLFAEDMPKDETKD